MKDNSIRFEQTQVHSSIAFAVKDKPEGYITEPFETTDQNNKTVYKIVKSEKDRITSCQSY